VSTISAGFSWCLTFFLIITYRQQATTPTDMNIARSKYFSIWPFLLWEVWHSENPKRATPHSPGFPTKDCSVMFVKTPPSGIWPCRLLKDRFKLVRMVKLARYSGIVPEILLWDRSKVCKPVKLPKEFGIEPSIELVDRFKMVIIWSSPIESGRLPRKRFLDRSMLFIRFSWPISIGNAPLKKFWDRFSWIRLSRRNKLGGKVDDNWLLDNLRISNLVRLPMPFGMEPENLLPWRNKCSAFFSIPAFDGMEPTKLFPLRSSSRRFSISMIDSGIAPCSWLSESSITLRPVKFEKEGGSWPVNLFLCDLNSCSVPDRFPM
jgi:hypothetical protein